MGVYSGLRVLDLSRVLAGPYCGQMLADFGADVIKIEEPGGDENRRWAPVFSGVSANFASVNRGKRALTLNLKSAEGQDILRALVAKSDVVIDSFLPGVATRLGVDDATLRTIRPDIVHVSITGYGHTGPMADRPGYDLMLQAFSGMMEMTGDPGGTPVRAGASFVDMATGLMAYAGVATALYARALGRADGQQVQVSLLETAIALLGYHVPAYTMAGKEPQRDGSGVWHIVPYQAFRTTDGFVLAGATNDATWQRLCQAIGADALGHNPRYATTLARVEHRSEIIPELERIFATRRTGDWVALLDAHRVPCSPVNRLAETLAHPQIAAMKMLLDAPDRNGGTMRLVGVPLNLSTTGAEPGAAPPELGEHSAEILKDDLGLSPDAIAALKEKKVI